MIRKIAVVLLCLACSFGALGDAPEPLLQTSFGDFPDELRQLRSANKKGLILIFEMEACPYCKRFHDRILSRKDVIDVFRRDFSSIRVDIQGAGQVQDFAGQTLTESRFAESLKIHATPTTVAFDTQGRELARFSGVPADATEFLRWREYVLSDRVRRQSFSEFTRQRP